ncbi:MAG: hypothetical protein ACQESH_00740 [Campylobacterota bacterium]
MSLTREIKRAGEPLSSEEKLMASFIKYEQFFKKYKYHLLIILIAIIGLIGYMFIDSSLKQSSLKSANEAFLTLKQNPSDTDALRQLEQNNEKLYQLYMLNSALKNKEYEGLSKLSATAEIQDIASYHQKLQSQDLESYSGVYRDLANLIQGYHLLKSGELDAAHAVLSNIPQDSQLASNVKILQHYIVSK